ncbi:hypothetical protein VTK56DRAFT_1860 [Thermocarpiscus australiensis]
MEATGNPSQTTYTTSDTNTALQPSLAAVNGVNGVATTANSGTVNDNMSQQSFPAVDPFEADDAMSEDAPLTQHASPARAAAATTSAAAATATTTTSARGRGRGRWTRSKSKVAKPAQPKAPAGRGRRQKVYDSIKAQAAHERTQELKQTFSSLMKLVKPVVQEIAERSINELIEDPSAFQKVPEYENIQNFLRERRDDTIKKCDLRLQYELAMAENVYQHQCEKAIEAYNIKLAEACEERYGQLLLKLDMLEYLYDTNLPVDLPALPDERYLVKNISQEEADSQGIFYQTRDGVEVPFPGDTISDLMAKPQTLPLEASKRKAEGQPEGQPAPKMAATAKDDDAVPQMARHPAGLLGAVEALPETAAASPDSSAEVVEPAEEAAAEPSDDQPRTSGAETPLDGPELPLPRAVTDPDEFGVRLIARRPTRMDVPNNRIMVPNLFDWDDLDIGFRDSSNCAQKGATKQRRGKYLGKPGSNYMFIDRRVGIWDSTLAAGEFDEELVKKHNLHPTLGIFLPNSVNEQEPPKPLVTGWKPVVFVPPSGKPIHTSRSVHPAMMDKMVQKVEDRFEVAQLLRKFCQKDGISPEEIAPDPELVEPIRRELLLARGLDPDQLVQREPSSSAAPSSAIPARAEEEETASFAQFADDALRAAAAIEEEEEAVPARTQPSRPYDAIRDVFTDNLPARKASPPTVQDAPAVAAIDTSALSWLADAALLPEAVAPKPAMVEPLHYDQAPPDGLLRAGDYDQPDHPRPLEYPQPEPAHFIRPNDLPVPNESVRANDFLRTALNPPPAAYLSPAVPPIQQYPAAPVVPAPGPGPAPTQPSQSATGRTPFSSTGTAKGLPALRPVRSLLNDTPQLPEPQSSPALQHGSMVVTNTGAYFPPAPSRSYHNGYSFQEPMQPMQTVMPQQPLTGPLQGPPIAGQPLASATPRQMSPYSVSPPPYRQTAHPALGPAPAAPAAAPPPILPQGAQQQPAVSAPSSSTRSRPGSSSAPSAANPPTSKYRKLEPAPTPPHRLAYSNGQELRTVPFDYREAIKDYTPVEAPPRHGPTQIRGWTHNNIRKARPTSSKGDASANANSDEPA